MKPNPLPSFETLSKLIKYDPKTGQLIWLERNGDESDPVARKKFNVRFAGKPALNSLSKSSGYKTGRILGKAVLAHRVAWVMYYKQDPHWIVDHINGNKTDNRISNLRIASHLENTANQKIRVTNSSGAKGVKWHKGAKKWVAVITKNYQDIHLGCFDLKEEAIFARAKAEKELFGQFCRENELEIVE